MEKRVVIFLVLSLAVILGYDLLLKQFGLLPATPTVQEPGGQEAAAPRGQHETPSAETTASAPRASSSASDTASSGDSRPSLPPTERTVTVETDFIRVAFNARGGVISSWELKRHYTSATDGNPVQLVYQGAKFKEPLSITTSDVAADKALREGLYAIETDFTTLDDAHPTGHVTLRFHDAASGLKVQKRLTFRQENYLVDVSLTVDGLSGPYDIVLGTNFGIVEWGDGFIGLIGSASLVDGKVEKETPDLELERKGSVQWVALQDKYFLSVLMPQGASAALAKKEGDKLVSAGVRLPASGARTTDLQLYAGPKEYDTLRSLNVGLEETIDFG